MKRIILAVLIAIGAQAFGQDIPVAFGFDATVTGDFEHASVGDASDTSVNARLFLQTNLGNGYLLQPYAGFTTRSHADPEGLWDTATAAWTQFGVGGGLGVFRRITLVEGLSVDLGASGGVEALFKPSDYAGKYSNVRFVLESPLALQIVTPEKIFFRISFPIFKMGYRVATAGSTDWTYLSFYENGFVPTVGMGWVF